MKWNRPGWSRVAAAIAVVGLVAIATPTYAKDDLPTIADKTKDHEVLEGFFRVYRLKQRILAEIPRSRLGKPFLLTSSFAGGNRLYGFQWTDQLVEWERLDKKLLLMEKNVQYRADKNDPVAAAVTRTYSDRVVRGLAIVAEAKSSSPKRGYLIDLNDLLAKNAKLFFGSVGAGLDSSLARIHKLKVFPKNVEVAITMPEKSSGNLVTLHYSLVELPSTGYKPRPADDRIGYFLTAIKDFTKGGSTDRFVRHINRWNLKKKDASLKLSPPVRPIVFYIEKTVPIRYRRFVEAGILEWNKAFEKIGFSGAVKVRQQDTEFTDLDPEDARYSFFRWITSDRGFAMGPSRVNPMTGEIFDADIIFDDAMVRSYLRQYELLMKKTPGTFFSPRVLELFREEPELHPFWGTSLAPTAAERNPLADSAELGPEAHRGAACALGEGVIHQLHRAGLARLAAGEEADSEWPEEFIGAMIKEVVMHEVGHTLGLRHNFIASTWLPIDKINGEDAPEVNVASVMDYNPINLALQETTQGAYVTASLGPYDYRAIEYGYKEVKKAEELTKLARDIAASGHDFATDEDASSPDPYVNRWDIGSDPLLYAEQQIDLVKELLPKLAERIVVDGDDYRRMRQSIDSLLYDLMFAGRLAGRFVGGERYHRDHKGDPNARPPIEVVPAAKQRRAVKLICDRLLRDDAFALSPELVNMLGRGAWRHWGISTGSATYPLHDRILAVQKTALGVLVDPERLQRVRDHHRKIGAEEEAYSISELYQTLTDAVFEELAGDPEAHTARSPFVSTTRLNLQQVWIGHLVRLAVQGNRLAPSVVRALAAHELQKLSRRIEERLTAEATGATLDAESRAHLRESQRRIAKALDADYVR